MSIETKPSTPQAFPVHPNCTTDRDAGMTLRDYFAAKAMAALLSNSDQMSKLNGDITIVDRQVCATSYRIADAMLKQREI